MTTTQCSPDTYQTVILECIETCSKEIFEAPNDITLDSFFSLIDKHVKPLESQLKIDDLSSTTIRAAIAWRCHDLILREEYQSKELKLENKWQIVSTFLFSLATLSRNFVVVERCTNDIVNLPVHTELVEKRLSFVKYIITKVEKECSLVPATSNFLRKLTFKRKVRTYILKLGVTVVAALLVSKFIISPIITFIIKYFK